MKEYGQARAGPETLTGPNQWLMERKFPKAMGFPEGKRFEATEYPIVAMNFQSVNSLWIADPEIAADIFTTK